MSTVIKGKIIKRKKQPAEFGAENIDNTAPVNKLLDDLQQKNNQAFTFYYQTIRQRSRSKDHNWNFHYTLTGHPLNAFTEEWDGGLHSGYFEPFTYKCINPKIMTKMKHIEKCDPVTEYLKKKNDWKRDLRNYRLVAASNNMMQNYERLNEEVVLCPKHLVDMAAHVDSDPDPYFDSSYNWYYAGAGNLQLICIDWVDFLLHSEFSTLYLYQFSKSDMTVFDLDHAATFDCEGNKILETICSSQNIIALRTMNKIYILKIDTSGENLQFEEIKATESEMPFTSISFDNHHKNILYITTLDNKLTIVNLDRLTGRIVRLKNKVNSLLDNWSAVISSDRVTYTHVARNSITFYDKRTNDSIHVWNGIRNITDDIGCNDITVAKQCEGSTSLYFGTDHHLFLIDSRYPHRYKPKVVQRWTHGMQCVPTYMSICNFEYSKEIICLSSQWCEDTCVVTNYTERKKETEMYGVSIPYRPPSILNTLCEARQKLLCLDLYNPIDSRVCTAITGSIIIEQGENYVILMQNSLGDISYHTLYPEHMEPFITDDSLDHLHEWSKTYQKEKKNFEVSSIEDISGIWKKLKKVPESHIIGGGGLISDKKSKYNEQEILDAFENEGLDNALLDVWLNNPDDTIVTGDATRIEQSSFISNLHYSDSE